MHRREEIPLARFTLDWPTDRADRLEETRERDEPR
jgi:hypothetical protein